MSGANLFKPKFSPPTAAKPAVSPPAAAPRPPTAKLATAAPPHPSRLAPAAMTATAASTSSTLDALLRLQEQTADLHRQYLDGQAKVLDSIQALLAAPAASAVAPAAAAATATTVAPAEARAAGNPAPAAPGDDVARVLLAIVADKTGYPTEMLELSMGLDADLGIDSIKRVEILSALQQRLPAAPAIRPEHLGELQTLGHIVDFLSAGLPVAAAAPAEAHAAGNPAPAAPGDDVAKVLLAIVADKTGYPTEMLELSMGLDADLGIDSIKRVEILSALRCRLSPTSPIS
ncbi:MAG: hypothetical protein JRH16_23750 [Deltaproteobacteria bacterium]|nr:hypothetical protein [Deltaproteobacteria bacterium]